MFPLAATFNLGGIGLLLSAFVGLLYAIGDKAGAARWFTDLCLAVGGFGFVLVCVQLGIFAVGALD